MREFTCKVTRHVLTSQSRFKEAQINHGVSVNALTFVLLQVALSCCPCLEDYPKCIMYGGNCHAFPTYFAMVQLHSPLNHFLYKH